VLCVLFAIAQYARPGLAAAGAVPLPLATVVALESSVTPTPGEFPVALAEYAAGAKQLRRLALEQGRVDYAQVIAAAYPSGAITEELLAAKATWRAALPARGAFLLLADYRTMRAAATVEVLTAAPDPRLKSTLVAQYEAVRHWIGLAPVASDFCVFHEAGHALQREALRHRACDHGTRSASHSAVDRFDAILQAGRTDATSVARLRYLTSQDEFEVRLQDLNRFHARCVAGRPILSPLDSLRALAALGVAVSFTDASAAFAAGQETLSYADFAAIVSTTPPVPAASVQYFEDARELRLLRRLVMRMDPTWWPPLLAKILFEAPGHL
jgi:hypothetical protein